MEQKTQIIGKTQNISERKHNLEISQALPQCDRNKDRMAKCWNSYRGNWCGMCLVPYTLLASTPCLPYCTLAGLYLDTIRISDSHQVRGSRNVRWLPVTFEMVSVCRGLLGEEGRVNINISVDARL